MRTSTRGPNRLGITCTVVGIAALTVVARWHMPHTAAARDVAAQVALSPRQRSALDLIRELTTALERNDEQAFLSMWYFEPPDGDRKRARVLAEFRERPDRRQEIAKGLRAALTDPRALSVTGIDESFATFDYTFRKFRNNRPGRIVMVHIDSAWRITDLH